MREDDLDLQPETLFVAPRSPLEQQLANIWADVLGVRQVGVNDNFFDLGGHSLLALRVVCRLRDAIGADIPLRVLAEKPTVAEIASALEAEADKQGELQKETPLVVINGNGSKLPIFAVHPIGGTTFCYRELARHMGSDQPFYGLQAAGLDSPNLERKRIEEMASEYIEAIKSVRAEGPYLLMGWSYGGVVAFEMGQQLIRQGEKLVLTVVLDAPVPGEMGEAFSKDEGVVATLLARELARQKGVEINLKVEDVIGKQGDEQLRIVAEELSRSNVAPKDVGVEHIKRVLAGYEKRAAALMQYEAKVYAGELGVIRAKHKDEEMMKMLGQAQLNLVKDETYGWKKVCEKEVYSQEVGGHHETMLLEPQVRELAQKLNGMIEQAIEKWRREESLRSML
jgi:thioesterase domain-containing protein/acyl carrier protein